MTLFYAYAKNINDDWSHRYLITFASRAVADEWWRAVADSVAEGYNVFSNVKRVTPQFYTHNPAEGSVARTIIDPKCASKFLGRVFFTLINDRDGRIQSICPPINITDHISGKTYFIRSVDDPHRYWYVKDQYVHFDSYERTRFRVGIKPIDGSSVEGKVMINSDDILISVAEREGTSNAMISTAHNGILRTNNKADVFKFWDFGNGFIAGGAIDEAPRTCIMKHGFGQRWELVE